MKRAQFNERNFSGGCSNIADGRLRLLHKNKKITLIKIFFKVIVKLGDISRVVKNTIIL
ncbi:hypothetical protein AAJ76_321000296 [Vairimorpha ceranae]|uniref:Uncharacterized protein n=1 Tax=Vairimorpha ceranae TaxID=40302 RepID=A0A0F9W9K4_9MICR|nr:hypothetical protein AAJ76_321000296 [Vairimorpha ceranae]KKO73675.1 hypothetical protein AAJ76_321000296 [Vairimorpha ceranae]